MTIKAYVDSMNGVYSSERELISLGYTHSVMLIDEPEDLGDVVDIIDFKNEFAAHTYADAYNMGLIH